MKFGELWRIRITFYNGHRKRRATYLDTVSAPGMLLSAILLNVVTWASSVAIFAWAFFQFDARGVDLLNQLLVCIGVDSDDLDISIVLLVRV